MSNTVDDTQHNGNRTLADLLGFRSAKPKASSFQRPENVRIKHVDPLQKRRHVPLLTGRRDCTIHVIAVAHERLGELSVFVQSLLNQTCKDWILSVFHDGPSNEFCEIMNNFKGHAPEKIYYETTDMKYGDYGHSLREAALARAQGDYVLLTNADNYFVPRAIEFLSEVVADDNPDVVMFDMVHSHHRPGRRPLPSYSFFETDYKRGAIDVSAAIVRTDLAITAGFRDKGYAGDATYFEDVAKEKFPKPLAVTKLPRVLFVHN